jgi:hypothetical protein
VSIGMVWPIGGNHDITRQPARIGRYEVLKMGAADLFLTFD